ncbi:hypothetical protein CXG81DRAFT_350, partial [Caulochytrium protostelioides]
PHRLVSPWTDTTCAEDLDPIVRAGINDPKDRGFLLKLDADLAVFLAAPQQIRIEYPGLNSYQRLMVHRTAQRFGLAHVVDAHRRAVMLFKT